MKYLISFIVIVLGTLLHFTYELSNKNIFVGLFSAVNESTWEHLKLAVFPILFVGIFEYIFLKGTVNNFIFSKFIASLFAMISISVIFYLYTGLLGKNFFIFDILTFMIGVILSEIISYRIMELSNLNLELLSFFGILILIIMFNVFTIKPPKIFLFEDPINKTYGINKKIAKTI